MRKIKFFLPFLMMFIAISAALLWAGDGMQKYTDAKNNLSFSYPAAWQHKTRAEAKQVMGTTVTSKYLTVVLYDPKDWTQNVNVQVLSPVAAQELTEAAYREFLKDMDRQFAGFPGFRRVSASVERLGDMALLQYVHEWTRPDGIRLRQKQLRTGKAGREVVITCSARADVYDEADKTVFSIIINTLTLDEIQQQQDTAQSTNQDEAKHLYQEFVRLYNAGRYDEAIPIAERSLQMQEQVLGSNQREVAAALNTLALLYHAKGDYAKAEPLWQRALKIQEQVLDPNHPEVAAVLANLAVLYRIKGDYVKAEPLLQRALEIREQVLDPNHPEVAAALVNLAVLYHAKGDYAKAEALYQQALSIQEQALGPNRPEVATALNNLALLYHVKGDYAKAEPLLQQALKIREQVLDPNHPEVAESLGNLAILYRNNNDYVKAEPLFQQALKIQEQVLGPNHPKVAGSLGNLAGLYHDNNDYAKAEPLFQRALRIQEQVLGPNHPNVVMSLHSLAALSAVKGDITKAIAYQTRAEKVSEHNIIINLATGSEQQKMLYLITLSWALDRTISLHTAYASDDPVARRLACTAVLQRKGRALDAMTDSIAALRRSLNPSDQALLDQLANTRSYLATLVLSGASTIGPYRAIIQSLEEQIEQLEVEISRRSAVFRVESQPVTIAAIQAAIPPEAVLVEFVHFNPIVLQTNQQRAPRYAAYVLRSHGEPAWVELGEAKEIEAAVHTLRKAWRDPGKQGVKKLARALDAKLMQPVRKLLGEQRTVLLSPDGLLHLVPFAALVDEQDRYLVEQYRFIYLTTGRDLLRLQVKTPPAQGPIVIADPDFGTTVATEGKRGLATATAQEAANFSQLFFRPLPGTAAEARALKTILPSATVLTQGSATEQTIKHSTAPIILHIATHGFFLQDSVTPPVPTASRGFSLSSGRPEAFVAPGVHVENPLLRSGLALAGANLHRSGEDDGILTALEASTLNLWGTKLVVLSACDTGVGEVKNGEGVYGLRRALVLAGAETQMMSLWPVSDEGTRDLMIAYYKALQAGEGRSEALRQVQLQMLKRPDRQHPFYWASFIQSGEWANLNGKR